MPSKMFEYGAYDKPIIAGVGGYAAGFVKKNISNHILFRPTDVEDFVTQIQNYVLRFEPRNEFVQTFSREVIDRQLAKSIVGVLKR